MKHRSVPPAILFAVTTPFALLVNLAVHAPAGEPSESPSDTAKRAAPAALQLPALQLLVPAYFYPGGEGLKEWDRLIDAAGRVPIVAIANPASGPGDKTDENYTRVLRRAADAGITIIGYVSTSYGKRPRREVEADINCWLDLYPGIKGFLFDEQASGADLTDHYAALARYARGKLPQALVINNPGTQCAEDFLSRSAADTVIWFENGRGFDDLQPADWGEKYPPQRFAALAYKIAAAPQMRAQVKLALKRRLGYVFVTDEDLPNPWDRLPPYWQEEVAAVRAANRAGKGK